MTTVPRTTFRDLRLAIRCIPPAPLPTLAPRLLPVPDDASEFEEGEPANVAFAMADKGIDCDMDTGLEVNIGIDLPDRLLLCLRSSFLVCRFGNHDGNIVGSLSRTIRPVRHKKLPLLYKPTAISSLVVPILQSFVDERYHDDDDGHRSLLGSSCPTFSFSSSWLDYYVQLKAE